MEQSIKIAVFSFCVLISSLMQAEVAGPLLSRMEIRPGRFKQAQIAYVSDAKSYVNGGITFTYPKRTFKTAPSVTVSIELVNLEYVAEEIVMPTITFNDKDETVVRVNRLPLGIEACTDDVIVHIHAIGE